MTVRGDKRLYFDPSITGAIRTRDKTVEVHLTNISSSGLAFQTEEQFKKGDKLLLELKSDSNYLLPQKIKAKIINEYGDKENGCYEYGVRFLRISYWYEKNCIHNFVYSEKTDEAPSTFNNRKHEGKEK